MHDKQEQDLIDAQVMAAKIECPSASKCKDCNTMLLPASGQKLQCSMGKSCMMFKNGYKAGELCLTCIGLQVCRACDKKVCRFEDLQECEECEYWECPQCATHLTKQRGTQRATVLSPAKRGRDYDSIAIR